MAEPSAASVARPSSVPSAFFTTTVPVGAVPVDPSRATVTLAEEAWPALDGSGTCVAATLVATLQIGDLHVVDAPAVDAAAAVATDVEAELDRVTGS